MTKMPLYTYLKYAKENQIKCPTTPRSLTTNFINEYKNWISKIEKEYTARLGNALVEALSFSNFFLKPIESFDTTINKTFNDHLARQKHTKDIIQPPMQRPLPHDVHKESGQKIMTPTNPVTIRHYPISTVGEICWHVCGMYD